MEEIKVGEYVRLKNGKIRQIKQVEKIDLYKFGKLDGYETHIYFETDGFPMVLQQNEELKLKHGLNIIDLIEKGDYVNGELVTSIIELFDKNENVIGKKLTTQYRTAQYTGLDNRYYIYEQDIKSIVTKEQYNSMKYIVGDESNEM